MLKEKDFEYIYRFEKEVFPEVVSIGECLNFRNCKSTNVDLADGWCIICWDKSETAKTSIQTITERRRRGKGKITYR